MKKAFLLVLSCFAIVAIYSQNIVKEHYTVSGGLLGAANISQFRVTDDEVGDKDYNFETGWAGGLWVNFPVSSRFSIEPQFMYSSYNYRSNSTSQLLLNNGKINYLSVPLLLKFDASEKLAITFGPQIDFFSSFEDEDNRAQEDDFKKNNVNAFAGLEIFPHGRVTIFGRYIHGFSNMDNRDHGSGSGPEYKNMNIQTGLKLKLFGKKVEADSDGDGIIDKNDKCPNQAGTTKYDGCPIPDTDADGINDEEDKCPSQPGTAKYNGCPVPDTDKDGINDEQDKCPNEPGIAKYNGCPIPDTDKDGINDEEDKCPTQAGPATNNGCPIADRDSDGINDEEDKCPDVAGTRANNGCPDVPADVSKLLSTASQSISFTTNSAKLSTTANASLNKVVTVLNQHPEMKLRIEAHADNAEKNADDISEQRANAVKTYLVSKGISADRIEVEGLGSAQPVADNNTTAGRAKNRRVELKVNY